MWFGRTEPARCVRRGAGKPETAPRGRERESWLLLRWLVGRSFAVSGTVPILLKSTIYYHKAPLASSDFARRA